MDDYIGEIRIFAGSYAPRNWALCQGQVLNINGNEELYSIIGTQFGGDGTTNFQLPDLRGRCAVNPGGVWHQGLAYGFEHISLSDSQLPVHTHEVTSQFTGKLRCNDNLADHTSPVGNSLGKFKDHMDVYNTQEPDADMHDNTAVIGGSIDVEPAGGSVAHENMQPSQALNYIICVKGLYPERP